MKRWLLGIVLAGVVLGTQAPSGFAASKVRFWDVQSVDTMKYSRDTAREKLNNTAFNAVIERQVTDIVNLGATHVAIGTPYDQEFLPFMWQWVAAARNHGLNVWFRGNWSGWEGWFDYPRITRETHLAKTTAFITKNKALFEDGDIFTACPECENGGPGDPRRTGDTQGFRQFMIDEYTAMKQAFAGIGREVTANYTSMNGDVAKLVMDKPTTFALDGVVAIDHYVRTKERLVADITALAEQSGGKIVLAEFGAPIPDIHGSMAEDIQAQWVYDALSAVAELNVVEAVNYWVNVGGSTALWQADGKAKPVVASLVRMYQPLFVSGFVVDSLGRPVEKATVKDIYTQAVTNEHGEFKLPSLKEEERGVAVEAQGYVKKTEVVDVQDTPIVIKLKEVRPSFFTRLLLRVKGWFK